jgi:hypothetical protein
MPKVVLSHQHEVLSCSEVLVAGVGDAEVDFLAFSKNRERHYCIPEQQGIRVLLHGQNRLTSKSENDFGFSNNKFSTHQCA